MSQDMLLRLLLITNNKQHSQYKTRIKTLTMLHITHH